MDINLKFIKYLQKNDNKLLKEIFKTTRQILMIFIYFLVAPRHARIEREWGYFVAGKPYNISCNVMGSEPSPYIKILLNHKALKKMNVSSAFL